MSGQNTPRPGRFVTFEGIDGAGKSSQIAAASQWVQRSLGMPRAIGLGLALMGFSYLMLNWLGHWPVVATILQAVLFSLGSILCYPLFSARLPHYAQSGQMGSYYGFYASFGGCVALLSNLVIGSLLGAAGSVPPVWIWYGLAVCGVGAGWLLYRQLSQEIGCESGLHRLLED
jgi:MFS family permease